MVLPSLLEVKQQEKWEKLLQYGERVWKITGGEPAERVTEAITKTRAWFEGLGIGTHLSDYVAPDNTAVTVAERLTARGMTALGERADISPATVTEILTRAA